MALRNYAYKSQWLKSYEFDIPIIGIGNLSTGGTGKSPMTEYVIKLVQEKYRPAILSRGYGRKTSGFYELNEYSSALEVGDEPLQFKKKFSNVPVFVDENRVHGIEEILKSEVDIDMLVLDDVFQHRRVQPGFMILLTSYNSLFYEDFVLPAGNLRESAAGANRADLIVITKCPPDLNQEVQNQILEKIRIYTSCRVYFSKIEYSDHLGGTDMLSIHELKKKPLTVVTGIAKPKPFLDYLKNNGLVFNEQRFADHHNFTKKEIAYLDEIPNILTTEKDYMRLEPHIKKANLYYLPIHFEFLNNKEAFNSQLLDYLDENIKR